MEEIKFICVSFNNASYSRKLLESLSRQVGLLEKFSITCTIVDNSTNEADAASCKALAQDYPWASYLRPVRNLGYFGGLNYGIRAGEIQQVKYLVICNNDIEFEAEFCEKLIQKLYDRKIFAVCPDVITADGIHQNPHILSRIGWFRRLQFDVYFAHYYLSRLLIIILKVIRPAKQSPQQPQCGCELHMGVGACYVLTTEFLTRFNQLNFPFFLYGEEAYISSQIHSEGGVLWFDPELRAHHAERAAFSQLPNRKAYEFARQGYSDYRGLL
jgi:GT2 family glycosyltransferase